MSQTKFNVDQVRADFPNLKREVRGKNIVYLDNAATTFKAQPVIDAINSHYSQSTSNVHRGVHALSEEATSLYEGARDKVARFLNASSRDEIIFTSGTTDSINCVAQCFGQSDISKGDEVLITEMEHHSNIVPWQMLCERSGAILKVAPINDHGELKLDEFKSLLTPKTKLVSVVHISNSLGTINPIEEIINLAHNAGAKVLIDGAQAVSHCKVDVQALDCDFYAFSAHKLFGPTGTGVLYGKASILNEIPPYRGGGDMIASVTFEKTTYNVLPYKFEAGTPNVAGVIGLGAAIDYLNSIDLEGAATHKAELLQYATETILGIDGIKLIGTAKNKTSILSFVHPNIHAHDMGTLVDEQGVAIRTGHHCTQPIMKHFGVPATSRASFAFYNTKEDVDTLIAAINKAKEIFNE